MSSNPERLVGASMLFLACCLASLLHAGIIQ